MRSSAFSAAMSRRDFLGGVGGVGVALAAPMIVPGRVFGADAPSNRLTVGLIGNGLMCGGHRNRLLGARDVQILATCDVWQRKRLAFKKQIEDRYGRDANGGYKGCADYKDFEDLIARDDIDIVFVTTPDHWHAPISKAAMMAGKDVYCEKPLTLTVQEGRVLAETAARYARILQTGSQQRSNGAFRKAAQIVRNGWIGKVELVKTSLGQFPPARDLPGEPVPDDLDYDKWLGSTPWRPYNLERIKGNYGGGWRCYYEYGGRKNGDWGAHHFDIIQWALGMDETGPVEFIPAGHGDTQHQTHVYANGTVVQRARPEKHMIEFIGTQGSVCVGRGNRLDTKPAELARQPLGPEDDELYVSNDHHDDFFNAVRNRTQPIANVEVGHRSATVCHLSSIAKWVGRPIKWDPASEKIIGDEEAARHLERPRRSPYRL